MPLEAVNINIYIKICSKTLYPFLRKLCERINMKYGYISTTKLPVLYMKSTPCKLFLNSVSSFGNRVKDEKKCRRYKR